MIFFRAVKMNVLTLLVSSFLHTSAHHIKKTEAYTVNTDGI